MSSIILPTRPVQMMFTKGRELLRAEYSQVMDEFNYMDLFGFTLGGPCCEIEIKTADYDFLKEWRVESKVEKHKLYKRAAQIGSGFCPNRFYFMVLHGWSHRALIHLERKESPYGLLSYNSLTGVVTLLKKGDVLHDRPFLGEAIVMSKSYKDRRHKLDASIP